MPEDCIIKFRYRSFLKGIIQVRQTIVKEGWFSKSYLAPITVVRSWEGNICSLREFQAALAEAKALVLLWEEDC